MNALVIALVLAGTPSPGTVSGRVFDDRNANSRSDTGEPGLPGVVVSDGVQLAVTDAGGNYRLDAATGRNVFVITPGDRVAIGGFYHPRAAQVDFALAPSPAAGEWRFAHFSDTHVEPRNVDRLRRALARALGRGAAFAVVSGDLVRDALRVDEATARGYFDLYASETARSPLPVWSVMGNHDVFGIERHLSLVPGTNPHFGKAMYEERLGPRYYAFARGRIHFIVLDTIGVDDLWYYGLLDAEQLAWIGKELQHLPHGSTVVTVCHIPLRTGALSIEFAEGLGRTLQTVNKVTSFRHVVRNVPDLQNILAPYRWTLALQGHMHRREKLTLSGEGAERFHTAPTVGQPQAGIPSGIVVYTVRGDRIDDGEDVAIDP